MTQRAATQVGRGALLLQISAAILFGSAPAAAVTENKVIVETINDYSLIVGNHLQDTICNSEGDGFWTQLSSSVDFFLDQHYKDPQVCDTDFGDRDRGGGNVDNDNLYFDKPGNAISFVCGHGSCNAGTGSVCGALGGCNAGEHCTSLPPPPSGPNFGFCVANVARRLITSSTCSAHGNLVFYGNGQVAWGEDSASGSWGNAGLNGGTNFVILINSCGLTAPFYSQYINAFAGVHLVAGIMPINGDTINVSNRGTTMALQETANKNSGLSASWFATMDQMVGGTACQGSQGGHGINGCGAYYTLSFDSTTANAQYHTFTERWVDLLTSTHDAVGNGAGWIYWHCNYDCNTYPW